MAPADRYAAPAVLRRCCCVESSGDRPGSRFLTLRFVDDADMGGDNSPTFGESYPRLHLPPDFWAGPAIAIKQRRRHRGVAAIGGDDSFVGLAHQPDRQ